MRCITLHQPHATLIAIGAKSIETRSWPTSYRGRLAIHAGKSEADWPSYAGAEWSEIAGKRCMKLLAQHGYRYPGDLPYGAVVATCTLAACFQLHEGQDAYVVEGRRVLLRPDDHYFGYIAEGRFGWLLTEVDKLSTPVPARGYQGLWNWEPS